MNSPDVSRSEPKGSRDGETASEHDQHGANQFPYCYPIWDPKTCHYGYVTVDGVLPPNPVFPGTPFVKSSILSKEGVTALYSGSDTDNPAKSATANSDKVDEDTFVCFGDNFPHMCKLYNEMVVQNNTNHKLYASLEDIYRGCSKTIKVKRIVGDTYFKLHVAVRTMDVFIKPGCETGNKIAFPGHGNHLPGHSAGTVIFELVEKPHPIFKREGMDLRYTHKIALRDALCGTTFYVPLLSGGRRQVVLKDISRIGTVRRLFGDGMPNSKNPNWYGDVIVDLDIIFPTSLSSEQKLTICQTLSQELDSSPPSTSDVLKLPGNLKFKTQSPKCSKDSPHSDGSAKLASDKCSLAEPVVQVSRSITLRRKRVYSCEEDVPASSSVAAHRQGELRKLSMSRNDRFSLGFKPQCTPKLNANDGDNVNKPRTYLLRTLRTRTYGVSSPSSMEPSTSQDPV